MMLSSREFILAQNDDLKAAVMRFSAYASLPNCGEVRRLTLCVQDSFRWLEGGCADQVFIDQFCAAIRGLSFATMDLRPERTRGAGWGVEDVLLALVRMLRHHVVRIHDSEIAKRFAATRQRTQHQSADNNVDDSNNQKVTTL